MTSNTASGHDHSVNFDGQACPSCPDDTLPSNNDRSHDYPLAINEHSGSNNARADNGVHVNDQTNTPATGAAAVAPPMEALGGGNPQGILFLLLYPMI